MAAGFSDTSPSLSLIWTDVNVCFFCTLCLAGIVFVYCKNVYQDLYTVNRNSVRHCRILPPITSRYKIIKFLMIFSLFSYFLFCFFSLIIRTNSSTDPTCLFLSALQNIALQFGKTGMYYIYLLRLHTCYGDWNIGYPRKNLLIIAGALFLLTIGFSIFIWIAASSMDVCTKPHGPNDPCTPSKDLNYINYCFVQNVNETFLVVWSVMILTFDLIGGIGCAIAYFIPLERTRNKIIENQKLNENTNNKKEIYIQESLIKLQYTGYKYFLCALISFISSVIGILSGVILNIGIFLFIDALISSLCLLFLSVYYPDDVYYQRLCSICINLFPKFAKNIYDSRSSYAKKEKDRRIGRVEENSNTRSDYLSYDTSDAYKQVDNAVKILKKVSGNTKIATKSISSANSANVNDNANVNDTIAMGNLKNDEVQNAFDNPP